METTIRWAQVQAFQLLSLLVTYIKIAPTTCAIASPKKTTAFFLTEPKGIAQEGIDEHNIGDVLTLTLLFAGTNLAEFSDWNKFEPADSKNW